MRTVKFYQKRFLPYMNHLQKVVLLSDIQFEVGFQWTNYWKRRTISQQSCEAGIIDISRRKDVVCKWSIIKHEKARYKNFLREWSCLNSDDDEYAAHHESS